MATGEAIPLRGLEGVPGLPGAPQDEAGLTRKFETSHVGGATGRTYRLGMQPWALSLPDKELCSREALAVCTPPAPEM